MNRLVNFIFLNLKENCGSFFFLKKGERERERERELA